MKQPEKIQKPMQKNKWLFILKNSILGWAMAFSAVMYLITKKFTFSPYLVSIIWWLVAGTFILGFCFGYGIWFYMAWKEDK
jgi:hypothetical protein